MKKEMKELIDNVTHYIHNNKSLLVDFQQQLDGFQYKASSISMLGDLVNFYKQKAIMYILASALSLFINMFYEG